MKIEGIGQGSAKPVGEFVIVPKKRTPEEMVAWEAERRIALATRIEDLGHSSNPPKRHWERRDLDRSGPWGRTASSLEAKLGNGFLVALIGLRGNGKTQLGVELIRGAAARGKRARYTTATEFFMDVKASYKKDSNIDEHDVLATYRKPSLLVMDEVGRRGETDWEDRLLFELLDKRYGDLKDTLLLSNQERQAFLEAIGPSLASRMSEGGGIINCEWGSFR